jgi:hypothetical protein
MARLHLVPVEGAAPATLGAALERGNVQAIVTSLLAQTIRAPLDSDERHPRIGLHHLLDAASLSHQSHPPTQELLVVNRALLYRSLFTARGVEPLETLEVKAVTSLSLSCRHGRTPDRL